MTQARTAETQTQAASQAQTLQRWRVADVVALYELPFNDLLYRAQTVHREHFDPNTVQLSTLPTLEEHLQTQGIDASRLAPPPRHARKPRVKERPVVDYAVKGVPVSGRNVDAVAQAFADAQAAKDSVVIITADATAPHQSVIFPLRVR